MRFAYPGYVGVAASGYLHGRIIENAGPRPTDPRFGLYDYPAILDALSSRGAIVISAQRATGTDVNRYAGVVVSQVETLIERGVPPKNVAVVGFSKGGAIATRVSSFLRRADVRFALLAACPREPAPPSLRFTGRVLSIFETSDTLGGSCRPTADRTERPASFKEVALSTSKLHGAFYLPIPAWVDPALDWVHERGSTRPQGVSLRRSLWRRDVRCNALRLLHPTTLRQKGRRHEPRYPPITCTLGFPSTCSNRNR